MEPVGFHGSETITTCFQWAPLMSHVLETTLFMAFVLELENAPGVKTAKYNILVSFSINFMAFFSFYCTFQKDWGNGEIHYNTTKSCDWNVSDHITVQNAYPSPLCYLPFQHIHPSFPPSFFSPGSSLHFFWLQLLFISTSLSLHYPSCPIHSFHLIPHSVSHLLPPSLLTLPLFLLALPFISLSSSISLSFSVRISYHKELRARTDQ